MRRVLLLAALWLLLVLTMSDGLARERPRNPRGETRRMKRKRDGHGHGRARAGRPKPRKIQHITGLSIPVEPVLENAVFLESYKNLQEQHSSYNILPGKQGQCIYQGLTMFNQAVWSPQPCVTCLCTGGRVVCDEITCPVMPCRLSLTPPGECCPVCMEPVPSDPGDSVTPLTPEEIQRILWREEEEHREEEERLRKKDEAKKRRRQEKKEQEERQNTIAEERRRQEEAALQLQVEKEEEDRRRTEAAEKEAWKREKKLRDNILREELQAAEEEEEVWLRGDVFQMPPKEEEEPEELHLLPAPIPRPPAATEDELKDKEAEVEEGERRKEEKEEVLNRGGLPQGCELSDVTVTCDNAKLTYFPPLYMPELKSLSLEGNNISSIPAEAFNGIPSLEWINLKKNKITSTGIDARTFKGLKMLRRLYLDGNLLDAIPPNLPPTLQELKINENKLQKIHGNSFHGLSSLVILELEANLLSETNVDPMAFVPLVELSYLRLGRNFFRSIPQGLPSLLLELYLENNLIEEIPEGVFNYTKNLNVVSLRHNRLEETRMAPLAWINHRNLESIDLSYNKLYLVPSYLPKSLVHLVLVGNDIERIPGFVFAHMDPGIEYLYLSYNKLDGEGIEPESFFGSYHSMVELCLDHNQLVTVPSGINEMTNLHFLRLNNNKIRSIPDEGICDPDHSGDSTLVALRLENNLIDAKKISPTAFSCVRSSSSVVLKPQRTK
ncbi:extracellular matrix protein 2 isoform X2 [Dunckerocampus dactyliophorus]|uniref:extracellular matrix protein 2 isoform X2 n=1 Tax=Dunckerocampus dactyliophorus TaxID=161453 RepID=UPI0024059B88|nr:extracellular matrix protein 2 isoform X2 [Dunckerocampus dactyliophorus]